MNKLLCISLFALSITLTACGDEHLVEQETATLKQYVFAGPDGFNGYIANYYDPVTEIYVEQGQTIKFFAGYSAGARIYTDETLQQNYNGLLWKIDESTYNLSSFRHTFSTPGEYKGSLETTDYFGDTLRTTFKIYVNTPNSITLEQPYDGYNQASPNNNQGLTLQWNISGIDPWETPRCLIFMDYDPENVWDSPLGYTDCNSPVTLKGSLIQSYDAVTQEYISAYDSSFTLYWGAKMFTKSQSGREYRDSTEIFHFSTKILDETSTLKIPLVYSHYRDNSILQTEIYLISEEGDTLQTLTNNLVYNTITTKVEPQNGLKIVLKETYRREYASESLVVDIPAHTVLTTDTVFLKDQTPPQIAIINDQVLNSDSIAFYIYDDGSGLNASKLIVTLDFDTLNFNYNTPTLTFYKNCFNTCRLSIVGEDYSKNSLPDVYWTIQNVPGYRLISGPYPNEGI